MRRRNDRLAWLGACHQILRRAEIRSLAEYRAATPDQLARLRVSRAAIRGLVGNGHPDVLLALWPPKDLHWDVARVTSRPTLRLLDVLCKCPEA